MTTHLPIQKLQGRTGFLRDPVRIRFEFHTLSTGYSLCWFVAAVSGIVAWETQHDAHACAVIIFRSVRLMKN